MKTVLTLLLLTNLSFAGSKTFTHKTTKDVNATLEKVVDVITDVENFCKNCKYKIKEVVVQEVLEYPSENGFYFWTHTSSIAGTFKYFTYIGLDYLDDDTIIVTTKYPTRKEGDRLKHDYGREHNIPFSDMLVLWTIKRVSANKCKVTFDGFYKTDNPLAGLFKKKIQEGIEKGAADFYNKFFLY